ncbi:twin-arginine translocase subunit TatB [Ochrobactrum soli]|uniref:Sec-independent protein translocase protein TatB n=1 Tax=Ochrobactrum teleogrylli TaxID=2479765 RepID=A0ABD5JVQ4_9HYPH|nr:Sec-independent protein translocase protein TatB [[Ochrobactrum] soli]RLL76537.1 twin-arginine translocase subunit TatB [[Ochrobactrum] soli]RRD25965.1 twin-arginine translocase subunit TatB [Brucellaceae bacterium VT-16-1752]WHT42638.1 Sec-independent protein translocase protein TatB [Ochrobactrum sp. SSR]
MLDVGWSELLVIAIVMIVVVGPKDLPKMLRAFGKATARMRATANEFRNQFNEALKEAELEDVKNIIDETRKLDPRSKLTQVFDPIRSAGEDLKSSIKSSTSMSPATPDKVAEVTTPVDLSGTPVPVSAPVQADTAPEKPAKAARAPRKTAAKAAPAAPKVTKAKAETTKPAVAKPAAVKKPAAKPAAVKSAAKKAADTAKPAADKAVAPAKKTTKKTGTKA